MEIRVGFRVLHLCLSFVCGTVPCADGRYSVSLSEVRKIVLQGDHVSVLLG